MKNYIPQLILLCLVCYIPCMKAQDEPVVIRIDTLSQDVYMLTGQGGNIGIFVGETHVFMIDDQFARISKEIKDAIGSLSDKPIAFLFNTHMHGDHSGGNANFNEERTTLVAHKNARYRIKLQQEKDLSEQKIDSSYFRNMLPEVTFSDDITFYDGDETIMAFHVHNAHTDGDSEVFFLKNNVIHMGDTYFAGRYPYIDIESGGSINGLLDAQKKVLMLINDDTAIIPGHGSRSNKAELQAYVAMLEDIKGKVQQAISEGRTLDEVISMKAITEAYDAENGGGFISPERIREAIYTSLTAKTEE